MFGPAKRVPFPGGELALPNDRRPTHAELVDVSGQNEVAPVLKIYHNGPALEPFGHSAKHEMAGARREGEQAAPDFAGECHAVDDGPVVRVAVRWLSGIDQLDPVRPVRRHQHKVSHACSPGSSILGELNDLG